MMNTVINKEGRHAFAIERLVKDRDEHKRTLEREEEYVWRAEEIARWHDARADYYLGRRWTKKAALHQISAVTIRAMKDDPSIG